MSNDCIYSEEDIFIGLQKACRNIGLNIDRLDDGGFEISTDLKLPEMLSKQYSKQFKHTGCKSLRDITFFLDGFIAAYRHCLFFV